MLVPLKAVTSALSLCEALGLRARPGPDAFSLLGPLKAPTRTCPGLFGPRAARRGRFRGGNQALESQADISVGSLGSPMTPSHSAARLLSREVGGRRPGPPRSCAWFPSSATNLAARFAHTGVLLSGSRREGIHELGRSFLLVHMRVLEGFGVLIRSLGRRCGSLASTAFLTHTHTHTRTPHPRHHTRLAPLSVPGWQMPWALDPVMANTSLGKE